MRLPISLSTRLWTNITRRVILRLPGIQPRTPCTVCATKILSVGFITCAKSQAEWVYTVLGTHCARRTDSSAQWRAELDLELDFNGRGNDSFETILCRVWIWQVSSLFLETLYHFVNKCWIIILTCLYQICVFANGVRLIYFRMNITSSILYVFVLDKIHRKVIYSL